MILSPESTTPTQSYCLALGEDKISELIEGYYQAFFDSLAAATDTDYTVETYTGQQATRVSGRVPVPAALERLDHICW